MGVWIPENFYVAKYRQSATPACATVTWCLLWRQPVIEKYEVSTEIEFKRSLLTLEPQSGNSHSNGPYIDSVP